MNSPSIIIVTAAGEFPTFWQRHGCNRTETKIQAESKRLDLQETHSFASIAMDSIRVQRRECTAKRRR